MPFDKYSDNIFHPYLALDPTVVESPRPRDDEEFIVIERNVSYKRLMQLLLAGNINVASSYGILLGIQKLREMGVSLCKESDQQ